jgi:hypothetical protein
MMGKAGWGYHWSQCPRGGGGGGAGAVLGVVAAVVAAGALARTAEAVALVILAACALGSVAVARLVWAGRVRRPAPGAVVRPVAVTARAILPPPRAIEGPRRAMLPVTHGGGEHGEQQDRCEAQKHGGLNVIGRRDG